MWAYTGEPREKVHGRDAGEMRIGVVSATLYEHLPPLLKRLRQAFPMEQLQPRSTPEGG